MRAWLLGAPALVVLATTTRPAHAIDVDDVGGETLTVDVTNTAAFAWRFDNRNDTAFGTPSATSIVDDRYGEWLDRFNLQLYWWRLRAGVRLDSAVFASRFTRDEAKEFAEEQLGPGSTSPQRNAYATSFFREMQARYRNTFYPSKLFFGYTAPGFEATVGDFYAQLGRGLVFSVRKVDELAVDTTVRGAKLDLDQDVGAVRIAGQLFGGQMNPVRLDEQSGRRLHGDGSALFFGFPTADDFRSYGFDEAGQVVDLEQPARPSYLEDTVFGGGLEVGPDDVSFGANGSLLLRKSYAEDALRCQAEAFTADALDSCAARFPVFTTNNESRLHDRISTFSGSVRVPDIAEHGDVYLEVAGQNLGDGRPVDVTGEQVEDLSGYALYGSGTVRGGPIAFNVEGKHYRSFFPLSANVSTVDQTFGASEFDTVSYNQVPTAEPIYVQTLGQPNICVSGGRGKADVRLAPEASLYAWLGHYVSWSEIDALNSTCETDDELRTHTWDGAVGTDLHLEGGRSFAKSWFGFRTTDRAVEEQTINTAAPTTAFYREGYVRYDVAKHLGGDFSIQAQGFHRHRYEPDFAPDTWNEGENYTALNWSPSFAFIAGYEYLALEGCEPDPETQVCHYVSGGLQYKAAGRDSTWEQIFDTVNLFVGQRRGAIRCVSGVCRRFPPFEGARLEIHVEVLTMSARPVACRVAVTLALAGLAGCGGATSAERAARLQDLPALRAAIVAQHRAGELDDDAAADIAEALAEGDLTKQEGWRGAEATLRWQACAALIEDALEERGDAEDDPAAAALWLLVSAGEEDADDFLEHDAPDEGGSAWWRSLGARALVDDEEADVRRARIRDGEERVRLGAIKASDEALDPEDLDALLEAARLDPLPAARAAAVRAIGRIGGPHAALGLRDVWIRADPRLRQAIASAWAAYPTWAQGGERELLRVAEQESGEPAVAAAGALARSGGRHASFGRGVLVRSIGRGTRGERLFAIAAAPSAPEIAAAVRDAAKDRDPAVASAALARIAREGDAKEQAAARDALAAMAGAPGPDAGAARGELARAGDVRAAPLAEKALVGARPADRAAAARDLAALGRAYRASALLADPERDVRIAAACAILGAAR